MTHEEIEKLVDMMRAKGVSQLQVGQLQILMAEAPAAPRVTPAKPNESAEEREEREWREQFARATRSSGAPIPPFPRRRPPPEDA